MKKINGETYNSGQHFFKIILSQNLRNQHISRVSLKTKRENKENSHDLLLILKGKWTLAHLAK
jgi:hypothetical protein